MNRRSIITKRIISLLLLVALFVICCQVTIGQDSLVFKKAMFKARLRTISNTMHGGFLGAINDTAIQLVNRPQRPDTIFIAGNLIYNYSQIQTLQIWRNGTVSLSALAGGLVGLGIGAAVARKEEPCPYCFETVSSNSRSAVAGTLLGMIGGAAVGAMLKTSIPIKGEKERMQKAIRKVKKQPPQVTR